MTPKLQGMNPKQIFLGVSKSKVRNHTTKISGISRFMTSLIDLGLISL